MKQRITFARNPDIEFEKSQIQVQSDSVKVVSLSGAKEHRLTIGFDELPREFVRVLEQCRELRIRWASPEPFATYSPFVSRTSPGLHVFVTPQQGNATDLLCTSLQNVFSPDLKCISQQESFIPVPVLSTRFSTSPSAYYYTILESLASFVFTLQQRVCSSSDIACQDAAFSLLSADALQIDFDAISRVAIISVYWSKPLLGETWTEKVVKRKKDRVEVGVLVEEQAEAAEDLKLGGWLTVIGEDFKSSATLFSFPSRHHSLPATFAKTFRISFDQGKSLHPILRLTIPGPHAPRPPVSNCGLHAHLTLPSWLFLDKYSFSDSLFLSAHNLAALHAVIGATDLEAPDWNIEEWGSAALFELSHDGSESEFSATIPLHSRYLTPNTHASENITVPWPAIFWACPIPQGSEEHEGPKMDTNPFDKINLGWDTLFGERTLFYHLEPALGNGESIMYERLPVPVLDLKESYYIEGGTVLALSLGVVWVLWSLLGSLSTKAGTPRAGKLRRS